MLANFQKCYRSLSSSHFVNFLAKNYLQSNGRPMIDLPSFHYMTETHWCGHGETSGGADLHDNYNTWQCDQEKTERSSGNWLESCNNLIFISGNLKILKSSCVENSTGVPRL